MDRICWNCDYFQPEDETSVLNGWCRRKAPRGIDTKSIPSPVGPYDVFPAIVDATDEQCGEYKTNAAGSPPLP